MASGGAACMGFTVCLLCLELTNSRTRNTPFVLFIFKIAGGGGTKSQQKVLSNLSRDPLTQMTYVRDVMRKPQYPPPPHTHTPFPRTQTSSTYRGNLVATGAKRHATLDHSMGEIRKRQAKRRPAYDRQYTRKDSKQYVPRKVLSSG